MKAVQVVKGLPLDDALKDVLERVKKASGNFVVVGVTSDKSERKPTKRKGSNKQGDENVNNASLAYLHENGSPADHIPPRPFLKQGIAEMKKEIPAMLSNGLRRELDGKKGALNQSMHAVGLRAKNAVQAYIRDSSHFAPLSDTTIENRAADRDNSSFHTNKGLYKELRRAGFDRRQAQHIAGYKPLIDTGALIGSINYGIRKDGKD